jgi:aminomethyltransferase
VERVTSALMTESSAALRQSPLAARHKALGAKLADFGGWEMPIEYPAANGGGVLAEHEAVRTRVGIFDVSHLGKAHVKGAGAIDFLNTCLTNDLDRISAGQAQYTLCCTEDGGVVDDLIVYPRSADDVLLVPNASNTSEVVRRLQEAAPAGMAVTNEHTSYGVIAVQGPQSAALLSKLGLPNDLAYMSWVESTFQGSPVIICRTGYTGEHGYELLPAWSETEKLWDACAALLGEFDGRVCGLGARDTLRTEMGYPLHGHELSLDISPVQARANWAVGWDKPAFSGRDALIAEKTRGATWLLRGLKAQDRGIPRPGMIVKNESGAVLGKTTSGTFSPSLKTGIALALLSRDVVVGDLVMVDVRGRDAVMEVVNPPFVTSHVR